MPKKPMKIYTPLGLVLTLIWLAFGFYLAITQDFMSLSLSDMGSFLSGIAAPPAFLWLILAFFQQGEELKLQAEELRNTVRELARQSSAMEKTVEHEDRRAVDTAFTIDMDLITGKIGEINKIIRQWSSLRTPGGDREIAWDFDPIPANASDDDYLIFCEKFNAAIEQLKLNYNCTPYLCFDAAHTDRTRLLHATYLNLANWSTVMRERATQLGRNDFASRSNRLGLDTLITAMKATFVP